MIARSRSFHLVYVLSFVISYVMISGCKDEYPPNDDKISNSKVAEMHTETTACNDIEKKLDNRSTSREKRNVITLPIRPTTMPRNWQLGNDPKYINIDQNIYTIDEGITVLMEILESGKTWQEVRQAIVKMKSSWSKLKGTVVVDRLEQIYRQIRKENVDAKYGDPLTEAMGEVAQAITIINDPRSRALYKSEAKNENFNEPGTYMFFAGALWEMSNRDDIDDVMNLIIKSLTSLQNIQQVDKHNKSMAEEYLLMFVLDISATSGVAIQEMTLDNPDNPKIIKDWWKNNQEAIRQKMPTDHGGLRIKEGECEAYRKVIKREGKLECKDDLGSTIWGQSLTSD